MVLGLAQMVELAAVTSNRPNDGLATLHHALTTRIAGKTGQLSLTFSELTASSEPRTSSNPCSLSEHIAEAAGSRA